MKKTSASTISNLPIIAFSIIFSLSTLLITSCGSGNSDKPATTQVDSTKASFKILGTWVKVDDPTNKSVFTADSVTQISGGHPPEILKYNWINEQEMDIIIDTAKKGRVKITIDGDNLTISGNGNDVKFIREGAAGNTATTADNDPIEVTIGTQVWMAQNLNVDTFRNGDTIPEAKTNEEWAIAGNNKQPAWCYYDNDPANGKKYGKLYNWYAVIDIRVLAPLGYHIPTDGEWAILNDFLGGVVVAGTKMKSKSGWSEDNGTNESGFSGLPGGARNSSGPFSNVGSYGNWWSSTETSSANAWNRFLSYGVGHFNGVSTSKLNGFSVRCLRD